MTEAVGAHGQCAQCGAKIDGYETSQPTTTVDLGGPYMRVVPIGPMSTVNLPCGCRAARLVLDA